MVAQQLPQRAIDRERKDEDLEKQSIPQSIVEHGHDEVDLDQVRSHVSHHEIPIALIQLETNDDVYDRFSHRRKMVITGVLSYCGFLVPLSSTTVLSAVPEVASEYATTGSIINLSNALYMIFMGISPLFWGPFSQVYGRRWVSSTAFRKISHFTNCRRSPKSPSL